MIKRGCSDKLSAHDLDNLTTDLSSYILQNQQAGVTLWQFGAYGSESQENAATRSRAPIIEYLLVNSKLWMIFLKYMPQGKVRDMYVAQVIQSCMANIHGVNTSKYPSSLFVTWFTKAVHMSLSHVRELKRYPDRFEFRINRLGPADRGKLDALLAQITLGSCDSISDLGSPRPKSRATEAVSPPQGRTSPSTETAASSAARLERALNFFSPKAEKLERAPATHTMTSSEAKMKRALEFFSPEASTTPKKRCTTTAPDAEPPTSAFLKAMNTPPPPGIRGGIRSACEHAAGACAGPLGSTSHDGVRAYVERSLKRNVRTTLRVKSPDDDIKRMWAEVRETTHNCHFEIVNELARRVGSGEIKSRDDAVRVQDELLSSWSE